MRALRLARRVELLLLPLPGGGIVLLFSFLFFFKCVAGLLGFFVFLFFGAVLLYVCNFASSGLGTGSSSQSC